MLQFRKAKNEDAKIYFNWANDPIVREQSYISDAIEWESHVNWFSSKLLDENCMMLIFQDHKNSNVGQVRIQKQNNKEALIGISVAEGYRGMGYAKEMLQLASAYFLAENPKFYINAFIKEQNLSSKFAFEKAGFKFSKITNYEGYKSFQYKLTVNEDR